MENIDTHCLNCELFLRNGNEGKVYDNSLDLGNTRRSKLYSALTHCCCTWFSTIGSNSCKIDMRSIFDAELLRHLESSDSHKVFGS